MSNLQVISAKIPWDVKQKVHQCAEYKDLTTSELTQKWIYEGLANENFQMNEPTLCPQSETGRLDEIKAQKARKRIQKKLQERGLK